MAEINCSQGFDTIILIQTGLPLEEIALNPVSRDLSGHQTAFSKQAPCVGCGQDYIILCKK